MTDTGTGTELIGRDAAVARVREAIVADRAIVVTGEPGIGKTTAIRAAIALTGRRGFEGGGFATLAWKPYLALSRAISVDLAGDAMWAAAAVERVVGPDALFVDDVQWVDAGTLLALESLVGRVALVVASRTDTTSSLEAVDRLSRAGAERLALEPLPVNEASELACRVRPGLSPTRARRIAERTGGNPLLIEQLSASGETESLRLAVTARSRALRADQREALALLALADRPLDSATIGARGDELLELGFAVVTADGLAIRHALLAEAVAADLDDPERRRSHARLAAMVGTPGERARHLAAAGDRTGAHAAALIAIEAATTPGERAAHLGLAAATADGPVADRLRIDAAASLRTAGDLDGAMTLLDSVSTEDAETVARGEAIRARVRWSAGDPEGMREAVARGLARVAGHGSAAEAMLRAESVVVTALVDGRFEQGLRDAEAAVDLATSAGADRARPLLLRATLLAGLGLDGWDRALEAVIEAARIGDDPETELTAANNLIAGQEMHGDPDAGRALATAMIGRARELRLAGWEQQFAAMLVNLDLHAGDLTRALDRSATLLEEALDPLAAQQVGLASACALVDLGRPEEASVILDRLTSTTQDDAAGRLGILHIAGELDLWAGRPVAALRRAEEYRAYGAADHPTTHLMDVTAGWAAMAAGVPLPGRMATSEPEGMLSGAQLERTAIERLAASADRTTAEGFDAAAAVYAGYHRRGELRTRWAAAETRRLAGLNDEARIALEALEPSATAQGFVPLVGRIRRSLRLLGVRRSAIGDLAAPGRSASGLTPREREIVRLVGTGASNVEIARRLGLGRPTVARLLSSAMDKLGVDSRAQVVAHADVV